MSPQLMPNKFGAEPIRCAILDALNETLAGFSDVRTALAFLSEFSARVCDRFADEEPTGEIRTLAEEFRNAAELHRTISSTEKTTIGTRYRLTSKNSLEVSTFANQNGRLRGRPGEALEFDEAEAIRAVQALLSTFPQIREKLDLK